MNQLRDEVQNPTDLSTYRVVPDSSRENGYIAYNKQNDQEMFRFNKDSMQHTVNVTLADNDKNDFADKFIAQVETKAASGGVLSSASLVGPEQLRPDLSSHDAAKNRVRK